MRRNKKTSSWVRWLIEFAIVTTGVLLALALDQWMESRKERAEETLLLGGVRAEFQNVLKEFDREIVFRKAMQENTRKIYALAESGTRPERTTFDPMLGQLMWWSSTYLTTGAVNSILVGGKLRLIENEEIRYFLAALPEHLASIKQVESNDYVTVRDVVVPYFMKRADISQILATMSSERPGSEEKGELTFQYRPKVPRDHAQLLNDTEFLGVVANVMASQENIVYAYEDLRPELERVIGLLDAELAD